MYFNSKVEKEWIVALIYIYCNLLEPIGTYLEPTGTYLESIWT